jgi:hypothetical protein
VQAAKPEECAGELQQPQEVRAVFVIADEQGAAFREPRQRPLDDPPPGRKPLFAGRRIELLLADAADVRDVAMGRRGLFAGRMS